MQCVHSPSCSFLVGQGWHVPCSAKPSFCFLACMQECGWQKIFKIYGKRNSMCGFYSGVFDMRCPMSVAKFTSDAQVRPKGKFLYKSIFTKI